MKNKAFFNKAACKAAGMLAVSLALGLVFAGCSGKENAPGGGSNGGSSSAAAAPAKSGGGSAPAKSQGKANPETDFTVTLTEDGTGVVITDYIGTSDKVHIPAVIQDMPVKEIGPNAFHGGGESVKLTSIVMPDGLLKIGYGAFKAQSKLSSVVIPDSVVEIGMEAFYQCYEEEDKDKKKPATGLTAVTLPKSLAKIDNQNVFAHCKLLKTVIIPEGVKVIGIGMFLDCTALTSVSIPDSVTEIKREAFAYSGLVNVTLGKSITSIPREAFRATKLKSITIPGGITKIETEAFRDCTALTSITISEGVTEIENHAFWKCTALESLTLSSTVAKIGDEAFNGCASLVTVTIPETVSSIEFQNLVGFQRSFSGCPKLNLAAQAALKRVGYTGSF